MSGAPVISPRLPWDELSGIAPLRLAMAADSVGGRTPQYVSGPRTAEELAAVLNWANIYRVAVAARGGGTKLEWGNPPRELDLLVSTAGLNRIVEHAFEDMTATVESGCRVADVQRALAEHGQRLAIDPLFAERATIGGLLATNDNGALRLRFGALRDLIIGITVALPDGTVARSGGKVVKNVAGYDLPKLFTGSLGTLGGIAQATFRLHPLPATWETFTSKLSNVDEANRFLLQLLDSTLTPSAIQLRAGQQRETFVDVLYEGIPAGVQTQMLRTAAMRTGQEPASGDPWRAREELWTDAGLACIAKFSLLPTQIADTIALLDKAAAEFSLDWVMVVQATGNGVLRLAAGKPFDSLGRAIGPLRASLESLGGSLVVAQLPEELRDRIETWGSAGSALPLMRRMKEQFDPAGILNPGRFVGGI